jgi:hypothetical protein
VKKMLNMSPGEAARTVCIGIHPAVGFGVNDAANFNSTNMRPIREKIEAKTEAINSEIGHFYGLWLGWHERPLAMAWRWGTLCPVYPHDIITANSNVHMTNSEMYKKVTKIWKSSCFKCAKSSLPIPREFD